MFNNTDIQPAIAYRVLTENANRLEKLSQKIIAKRNDVILAEAELLDAKANSFTARRAACGITEAKEWQKVDTLKEEKEHRKQEGELKNLLTEYRVTDEINANYKMAVKMAQIEINNLNLK